MKQHDSFTFVTDENGNFISLSPDVYYVLGYPPEDLTGKSFASLAARDSFGRSSAIMYQLSDIRKPFRGAEIGLARIDGRTLEAEICGRPVMGGELFRGYQGVVLVTAEYRPSPETPDRKERESELILDLVCHDLHNVNQIQIGYLELIKESLGPDNPNYHYVEKCMALVAGSSELLRNVQKLQLISTGVRTLEKMDLGKVIAEAAGQFSLVRDRDVRINIDAGHDYQVMANALLKDAFINLIGNAVKHSTGPLVIDIRVEKTTVIGKQFCQVTIDDNGPGIPDEVKSLLFNRFRQGGNLSRGKGLGLFLVGKLIEVYGGHVWAEDRVRGDYHQGSRFVVSLPLAGM